MSHIKVNIINFFNRNKLISNIAVVTFFDFISKIFSMATFIILIRLLSTSDYADFTFFNAVSLLVYSIIGGGLNTAYIRYESENISRRNSISINLYFFNLKMLTLLSFIIFFIFMIFKNQFTSLFFSRGNYGTLILFGIFFSYTLSLQRLNESFFQSNGNFKNAGLIGTLKNSLLLISIVVPLFFIKMTIIEVLFIYMITSLVISSAFTIKIIKSVLYNKSENNFLRGEYINSSFWLILYCLFLGIFSNSDVFFVSHFLNKTSLANYGIASKYYYLLLSMLPSITTVLRVRTAKSDMIDSLHKQRGFGVNWIKKTSIIIVPVIILGVFLTKYLFPIINGPGYIDSIIPFQILCVGAGISYIFSPNVNILMAMKKYKLLCAIGFFSLLINLICNYFFIQIYGIIAAAIIEVATNAFNNITVFFVIMYNTKQEEREILTV